MGVSSAMDPLTMLLAAFAKSFADQAGSRTADLVFDAATRPAAASTSVDAIANAVSEAIRTNPSLRQQVTDAINADIAQYPQPAEAIISAAHGGGLLESLFGISADQAKFNTRGRCPVGGHLMVVPPKYRTPDGRSIPALTTFPAMKRLSPLAVATCRQGHSWQVFAVASLRSRIVGES